MTTEFMTSNAIVTAMLFSLSVLCAEGEKIDYQMWGDLEPLAGGRDLYCRFMALINVQLCWSPLMEKNKFINDNRARYCEFNVRGGDERTIMWRELSGREERKYSVYENLPFDAEQLLTENPRAEELHKRDSVKTVCSMNFIGKKTLAEYYGAQTVRISMVNVSGEHAPSFFWPRPVSFECGMYARNSKLPQNLSKALQQLFIDMKIDKETKEASIKIMMVHDNGDKSRLALESPGTLYQTLSADPKNYCFETKAKARSRQLIIWPVGGPASAPRKYTIHKDFPFELPRAVSLVENGTDNPISGMRAFCVLSVDSVEDETAHITCSLVTLDKKWLGLKSAGMLFSVDCYSRGAYLAAGRMTSDLSGKE
jgi:hypothetical protein